MFFLQNVLWLLVLIGVMILIHELGHFWAARFFNVRVEVFSFGFGPRLFGFRKGDTDYRFSAIFFFGGYVKMAGEQPGEEAVTDPNGLMAKPRWQRLIIAFAGPFMNIVLAVALLTGLYMVKFQKVMEPAVSGMIGYVAPEGAAAKAGVKEGDRIVKIDDKSFPNWEDITIKENTSANHPLEVTLEREGKRFTTTVTPTQEERTGLGSAGWSEQDQVQLGTISAGMPADKAGLKKGDQILAANGQPIHSVLRFHDTIRKSGGKPVTIDLVRDGNKESITVQPVFSKSEPPERWMIGAIVERKLNLETTRLSLPDALGESIRQNYKGATLIYEFLAKMLQRRMSPKSIEGPIRIAQLSGEAAREGPSAFFMLMSMVSLNLAIFNLLPIPILDGGVIAMLLVEMLMRRDLSMQVKEAVFKVGLVFIMVIVVFVIYNDISKILPAG
jgi:regulator of sigma E protease